MAIFLSWITGFEAGSDINGEGTGTPTFSTTGLPPGGSEYCVELGAGDGMNVPGTVYFSSHLQGISGFRIRFSNVTPSSDHTFLAVGTTPSFQLRLKTTGNLVLVDANGTERGSVASGFSANTWHWVEYTAQHSNSGVFTLAVDGVDKIELTDADVFVSSSTVTSGSNFLGPASGADTLRVDDVYVRRATSLGELTKADYIGPNFHVRGFQSGNASATSDSGANLNSGNWSDTGERTFSDSSLCTIDGIGGVTFNDSNASGASPGPASASGNKPTRDDQIMGATFYWRLQRTNGSGRTHTAQGGNSVDGLTQLLNVTSSITTSFQTFDASSDSPSIVPRINEDFMMGFGQTATGGQDTDCSFMLAELGWASEPSQPSPSGLGINKMSDYQGFHGPYEA